jgi:glycerophosphoryl diester phosphodiesterase
MLLCRFLAFAALVAPFCLSAAVLSIAHRGDSMHTPENTIASFISSHGKADYVETDTRMSADGVIVVMHDSTVDRTTDGSGTVGSKTLAQLRLLDAGSWFSPIFAGERVATMEEMITNTLPACIPLIERKDGPASAYVAELRRLGVVSDVMVQSFDWNFLSTMHALEPGIRLGALGSGTFTPATLTNIINTGAEMVAWEQASVTPEMLNLVRSAGLMLFVWTVDGPRIKHFIDMGVDGIISNDPGAVKDYQAPPTDGPVNLPEGLVSFWKMDDGLLNPMATSVTDSKGTNHGTLVRNDGASHWFEGDLAQVAGSLKLEGTNAYVTLPSTESLDINTNALTLSAWLRLSNLPSQHPTSFGAIFDSTTDCYVFYLDKGNRELRFKVTDVNGHAARPGIPEADLKVNEWLHVVGTYSGSVLPAAGQTKIYLNGEVKDIHTGNDGSFPVGLTANVRPGQLVAMGREGPTGGNHFTGFIDELALWNRALTPAEVLAIHTAGREKLSLTELIRTPSASIQCQATLLPAGNGAIRIQFTSEGAWKNFRLLKSDSVLGPFRPVEGLTPVDLGNGQRAFDYPAAGKGVEYFRVGAE